jgi:hypothetical protein
MYKGSLFLHCLQIQAMLSKAKLFYINCATKYEGTLYETIKINVNSMQLKTSFQTFQRIHTS